MMKDLMKIWAVIGACALLIFGFFGCEAARGNGGYNFGPRQTITTTVLTKHVDVAGQSSHYMVTTDAGTFEIGNGVFIGIWNADQIYGQLEVGKQYSITTQGATSANFLWQQYPYVVRVTKVSP